MAGSTSQIKQNWLVIPAAAFVASIAASLAALFLIPRLRRTASEVARGRSEPVSPHSPFDLEYPPAP